MAAASGLHLVPVRYRNPRETTSFGTGDLIRAALEKGGAGGAGSPTGVEFTALAVRWATVAEPCAMPVSAAQNGSRLAKNEPTNGLRYFFKLTRKH